MKNIIKAFLVLGSAAMVASCDLTTETKSSFDESVVFSNYTLAEYNIYNAYSTFGATNGHRGRYLPWYGFNTDIECYNSTTYDGKNLDIAAYNCAANNGNLNVNGDPYSSMFQGIEKVNLTINGLRKYGDVKNNKDMAFLLGEALTVRALIYTELLKAYGEVPARFEPVSPETIYLNKSDKDVIYKQLLSDLEESFDYLVWPGKNDATKSVTRASLALAKGLYARLALMASGYSWRPEDGKVGTGDTGSNRLSNDAALSKATLYPKALAALEDVIKNSGLSLTANYEDLWRSVNNYDVTAGKEVIFCIPFSDNRGRWNYTFAVRHEANSTYTKGTTAARGGAAGPVSTLYYKYDDNDVRRDISCVPYAWKNGADGVTRQSLAGGTNWYFGKFRFEWMENPTFSSGFNDDGVKPVYMRYADILLMAAEIANELDDLAAAKNYLKPVRERAFKGNVAQADAYVDAIASKDAMFNAIVDERAFEFVGEMLRKADLIRWGMLKTKLDATKTELQALYDRTGVFATVPENVYYKYASDGISLQIYGLKKGESAAPGDGWNPYTNSEGVASKYYGESSISGRIASIYKEGVNPEQNMYWPINTTNIGNAIGVLKNDYGY